MTTTVIVALCSFSKHNKINIEFLYFFFVSNLNLLLYYKPQKNVDLINQKFLVVVFFYFFIL